MCVVIYYFNNLLYVMGLTEKIDTKLSIWIPIIFLTQFWIFAALNISIRQILNFKSNLKSFGIVFLSFLIIVFLSISFVMSRMNALPVNSI